MMNEDAKAKLIGEAAAKITKELTDQGFLIEGGWRGFWHLCAVENPSQVQVIETRMAFYAGALHVYSSMMNFLEPGEEPTEKDLDRMAKIADELQRFEESLKIQFSGRG